MNPNLKKVIVAVDTPKISDAMSLVDAIGDLIDWYKIGSVLFTSSGNKIIDFLHQRSKKIFLDIKLHDIPNVVGNTVKQISEMGIDLATVHCLGGLEMLQAASAQCRNTQLRLVGITLLTHQKEADPNTFGNRSSAKDLVTKLVTLAEEARLYGIICSPHEIETVKPKILPGFQLITAGIRIPGVEVYQDDQIRTASPAQALDYGADFVVIGRPITQAREPRQVVESLFH